MSPCQKFIRKLFAKPVSFEGIGLHSGKQSKVTVLPSEGNSGVVFKRTDLKNNNLIKADFRNVSNARLCTTLQNKYNVKVSTVEHLLAALYIAGIDNALIEVNNDEIPIMDGSAIEFLNEFKKVDQKILSKKRKYLKILEKVELEDGVRKISIEKSNNFFEVNFKLNYENKIIGNQENRINFDKDNLKEIIESRTFCLYEDIQKIKKLGLAKGGSLENAIVVDDQKVLNSDGLRNNKEFVNHKILDLAGDFLLSGYRVEGKVKCFHGGHQLTNLFLRTLFKNTSAFEIVELSDSKLENKEKIIHSDFLKSVVNA